MKRYKEATAIQSPAKQLEGFIAKFDPPVAKLIRSIRAALRRRFPTAFELVYDNYNFFVIGYCSTERPTDCIVSLAAQAKGVSLCFIHGATLPDPDGILEGIGQQTRFIRLASAARLSDPNVEGLIRAAIAQAKTPLAKTILGHTIIRSISAKQRPRRTRNNTKPKAARQKVW